jgi:hypothetical protein
MSNNAIESSGIANINPRIAKKLLKQVCEEAGRMWADKDLPRRFGPSGQSIYHTRTRSPSYISDIKRLYPGWRNLRASGTMEQTTKNTVKIRGIIQGENILIKITFRPGHAIKPFVREELTKVNKNEIDELMFYIKNRLISLIAQLPKKQEKMAK